MSRFAACILLAIAFWPGGWVAAEKPDRSGRWLIETQSGGGSWVPLIVLEMTAESEGVYRGSVVSSSAPFAFSVESIVVSGPRLEIQIGAEEAILVVAGEFDGESFHGSAGGMGLRDRPVRGRLLDERTTETPAAPEPEEYNAFRMATMSSEPDRQLTLLDAFIERFPDSSLLPRALLHRVSAMSESAAPAEEIRRAVASAAAAAVNPIETKRQSALMLAEASRLDLAEEIVREALSEADEGSRIHAELLDALGWTLFRKGRTDDSRKILEEAHRIAPESALIAMRLGAVLEQVGEEDRAELLYAGAYASSGHEAARERLEALYLSRRGTLEGLHERIDEIYLKQKPLFDTGSYAGPTPDTPLLAELFSSSECLPCQAADYAFDGLMQRFPPTALMVLSYHLHIPAPAPLASPAAESRAALYRVSSTPYAVFGGTEHFRGGGSRERAEALYNEYRRLVESMLDRKATGISLELEGSLSGDHVNGSIRLQTDAAKVALEQVRVFVALAEKTVHYTGRNGVHFHHHLVRKFAAETSAAAASEKPYAFSVDLDETDEELGRYLRDFQVRTGLQLPELLDRLNRNELALVAFAQDLSTGHILAVADTGLNE